MDIQTGLVCVTVAVISAIVIYVISMSTMKEKTYDEAMADLRKKNEEQFSQGQAAKDKIKDKKDKKKAGKKVKEKNVTSAGSNNTADQSDADGSNKNRVVFVEPEAAVLDEDAVVVKERKKSKKKEKPILLNKNEPNIVVSKPAPIQNHFEKIHPKDDFELKRSHSREDMVTKTTSSLESAVPQVKEQVVQKTKAISKNSGGSFISNNNSNNNKTVAAEQKVEKQTSQQLNKQNSTKSQQQQKSTEKNSSVKVDKNESVDNVSSSVVTKKESAITKQVEQQVKQQQIVVTQKKVQETDSNTSASLVNQQNSQNHSDKITSTAPSVKVSKKKKSELAALNQISSSHDGINVNLLMPLVQKAELSKSEIQLLIDFLLNKQQGISDGSSEWIEGRQDPVLKLKKQLAEKEKALADESEASAGLQARLKDLRTELNAEKHNVRTLEEAVRARQAEISSFAMKLQLAIDEKQAAGQQLQQLQTKLGEERLLIRKLQEEGGQAQNALQQELHAQRQQLDLHLARFGESQRQQQETIEALETQLGNQMQEHEALTNELTILQERSSHLKETAAQAQELARQVEELRSVRKNLEHHLTAAQFETGRLQTEVSEVSEQLNLARTENERLSSTIRNMENENSRLRETTESLNIQISSACVEARQLRDENETLAAQVTASMERPATEGRENGDMNNYSESKLSSSHIEEDREKIQKNDLLLEDLTSQLKSKEIQVENLTGEVNSYKTELAEQQKLVLTLKSEAVKHKFNIECLTNEMTQQKTQLTSLIEQLQSQQAKNNDLRTKNWKVMEALSSTEKLLQTKMNESDKLVSDAVKLAVEKVILEHQSSTRQLLQRVFPELVVPECQGQKEWFEQVEKALKSWKPDQNDSNQSSCFAELEKQNAQLQAMVNHYKNIIADTEGMLNKLQSHVELEEGKWGEKLQALQSQLEAVTRERDALQQSSCGSIQSASNGYNSHVDTASQTSSKRRRFTGWLRKRIGLSSFKKKNDKKRRHDSV